MSGRRATLPQRASKIEISLKAQPARSVPLPEVQAPATGALLRGEVAGLKEGEIIMAIDENKLASALDAATKAHQDLVNIGDEFKAIHRAKREPDESDIRRLHEACRAFVEVGKAVDDIILAA